MNKKHLLKFQKMIELDLQQKDKVIDEIRKWYDFQTKYGADLVELKSILSQYKEKE